MLWDIQALMKPALSVIDLIPNVHRTPALAALRRAVLDGRPLGLRLSAEDKELALFDAPVQLTSPLGARILYDLYRGGHLKLKKPAQKSLPALEAYIETEAEFRAAAARLVAEDEARQDRLAAIIATPEIAHPEELTPRLVDRVMSAHLGHGVPGVLRIAGLDCHRAPSQQTDPGSDGLRATGHLICWWIDAAGQRQGDSD